MEFKGTKGIWEVVEHNWSDTSIYCGDKVICTQSIYEETTEENQEELENEVSRNFKLISKAPEMLEMLMNYINDLKNIVPQSEARDNRIYQVEQLIKEVTEI